MVDFDDCTVCGRPLGSSEDTTETTVHSACLDGGLDVERLAQAIAVWGQVDDTTFLTIHGGSSRSYAAAIAREYAALGSLPIDEAME